MATNTNVVCIQIRAWSVVDTSILHIFEEVLQGIDGLNLFVQQLIAHDNQRYQPRVLAKHLFLQFKRVILEYGQLNVLPLIRLCFLD